MADKKSDFIDRQAHKEGIIFPDLVLRPDTLECEIGKAKLELSPAEFAMLWLFAIRCKNSNPPLRGVHALLEEFLAFAASVSITVMPELGRSARFAGFTDQEIAATADSLSEKIKLTVAQENGLDYLVPVKPNSVYGIAMPHSNIFCPRSY